MRTLLKAAGIKSYYCRIKDDRSVQKYDENFPKMFGNHVILMIPTEKGNIWLENTSQEIAFNHLNYTSGSSYADQTANYTASSPSSISYFTYGAKFRFNIVDFTDDASVVEAAGFDIHLTPGNRENIKITTPGDIVYANAVILSSCSSDEKR